MEQILYYLSKVLPYLVLFPLFAVLLLLALYIIFKIKANNNSMVLYGLFYNLSKKDILLLALIFTEFIVVMETSFVMNFTYLLFLFLFTPILLYVIINMDIISLVRNVIIISFLLLLYFFGRVFLYYYSYVNSSWYILMIYIMLLVFIFVIDLYMLIKNIISLIDKIYKKEKR